MSTSQYNFFINIQKTNIFLIIQILKEKEKEKEDSGDDQSGEVPKTIKDELSQIEGLNRHEQIAYVLRFYGKAYDIRTYTGKELPKKSEVGFTSNWIKGQIEDPTSLKNPKLSRDYKLLLKMIYDFRKNPDTFLKFVSTTLNVKIGQRAKAKQTKPVPEQGAPVGISESYIINEGVSELIEFKKLHPIDQQLLTKNKPIILVLVASMYRDKEDTSKHISIEGLDDETKRVLKKYGFKKNDADSYIFLENKKNESNRSSNILSYYDFLTENDAQLVTTGETKPATKDKGEVAVIDDEEEFDEYELMDEKFDEMIQEISKELILEIEEVNKLKSVKPSNKLVLKDVDHILEIVRLFKRAWRIHTTENIPSGRTDGKVSNRVFREYEPLGDRGGTSDKPGSGPWRNKKLYDKWESAVFDILADNKYKQSIFSENCTFEFQSGGETVAQTNKPLGKILMNFMTRLQSDSKMYQGGAMTQFMKEYFGLDIKIEETSFSSVGGKNDTDVNDKTSKGIVKTQVSFVEQKNALTGSDNIFDYFKNVKHNQKKASQKITFRIAKKQYFTLAYQSKEEFYFYYMNQFSYDKTNIEISENVVRGPIYLAKFDDDFEKLKYINISNGADVKDIEIIKNDIEILVDKDGKVFKEIKLFGVDELDFKSMPTSVKNLIGKLA